MASFSPVLTIDWVILTVYLAGVVALGAVLGRRNTGADDYFLGQHRLPWWAVLVSVVATETSALTVISIPGLAFNGTLSFLQLAFGYALGRIVVAWLLLPGYFTGRVQTAYQLLGTRWGAPAQRTASGVFMFTRALATSVRLFAAAIPLTIITGKSYPVSIVIIGAATMIYTYIGGIRSVVWVDVVQWSIYLLGGVAALGVALHMAPTAIEAARMAGKLHVIVPGISLHNAYAFGTALIGGAFLSAASHGADHLIVQRLLATRSLDHARAALVGSGLVVILEFTLFLLVGTVMFSAFPGGFRLQGDEVFPSFIATYLRGGLAGLLVAGILAAAMGSTASALNSLASATTHDWYASLTGERDDARLLRVGRFATLGWAVLLTLGALAFRHPDAPVVEVALSIASLTYGGLLGSFVLARVARVRQGDAIAALLGSALVMTVVVFAKRVRALAPDFPYIDELVRIAWPWYVPLGMTLCIAIGLGASLVPRRAPGAGPSAA